MAFEEAWIAVVSLGKEQVRSSRARDVQFTIEPRHVQTSQASETKQSRFADAEELSRQ
jgi:hypothetical protein